MAAIRTANTAMVGVRLFLMVKNVATKDKTGMGKMVSMKSRKKLSCPHRLSLKAPHKQQVSAYFSAM